jgi:ectoine hydroxylase-related dioxygenase (phytanoyl-CoA dioxygenase family)
MRTLAWDVVPGDALLIRPYTLHGADGNVGGAGPREFHHSLGG